MELFSTDIIITVKLVLSRNRSVGILHNYNKRELSGFPRRTVTFVRNGANGLIVQQN